MNIVFSNMTYKNYIISLIFFLQYLFSKKNMLIKKKLQNFS